MTGLMEKLKVAYPKLSDRNIKILKDCMIGAINVEEASAQSIIVENGLRTYMSVVDVDNYIKNFNSPSQVVGEGIAHALTRFAKDDGKQVATKIAEGWRDALESMAEISNAEQREACSKLLIAVNMFF